MYRFLLRAFPRDFRRQFGPEMAAVFSERRRDARNAGVAAYVAFWFRTFVDVFQHGVAERRAMKLKRGDSPMRSLLQDVRFAFRLFRQRPGFTLSAVLTLALGIGINVAAFSVVNGVIMRWLALPHPDQVVRFAELNEDAIQQPFSAPSFASLQASTRQVFQSLAPYRTVSTPLTGAGDAVLVPVAYTGPEFFDVIGVTPVMGRPLTADDAMPGVSSVVISGAFWRGRMGSDPSALGKTLELNGTRATIVGIMPDDAVFPLTATMWRPLLLSRDELATSRSRSLQAIGRLKPGVDIATANAAIAHANAGYPENDEAFKAWGAAVFSLRDDSTRGVRRDLFFIQGVAVIVLLIGCANIANLLLAAASSRQHELSIRASIGAGRRRLVRQLLAESLTLSMLGGLAGLFFALWLVPAAIAYYPQELPGVERISISLREMAVALATATGTTVLFGLLPAMFASRTNLAGVLKSGPQSGPTRVAQTIRWSLVTVEVVLTLTLLAGAALLVRSYAKLTLQPTGFDPRSVLTAQISLPADRYPSEEARRAAFDELVARLRKQPGVIDAATTMPLSFDGIDMGIAFKRVGANADPGNVFASLQRVSNDYVKVFKVPLLGGRFFDDGDTISTPRVLVVNQQFAARFSAGKSPVGMRLTDGKKEYEVIGVVADWLFNFFQDPKPFVLLPTAQEDESTAKIAIRTTGDPDRFAPVVRGVVRELDPRLPVVPVSLESVIAKTVALRRFNMGLLSALAAIALVLSVVGIYGVMSYVISQRGREMGIRIALGAAPGSVSRLMVRQGLTPMLIGIGGGIAGAWYLTTLLKRELFRVVPHDPWPLALAALGFLIVGIIACWIPARKSARINPVEVLRAE
jgi:putative ABC transport system permease protein